MFPIGLSTNHKELTQDLFRQYRDAGITHMEISNSPEYLETLGYDTLLSWAERWDVCLWSLHLPFYPYGEIDLSLPQTREHTLRRYAGVIRRARDIGICRFVVHPSGEPISDSDRPLRLSAARESLSRLADLAGDSVICVEDLPRSCLGRDSRELRELLDADDRLRLCFDTNHLLREDPAACVRLLGHRLETIHVSDYDFTDERHWLPGEGSQDWPALLHALVQAGYQGPWMYEIEFRPPGSMPRSRDLTCADFVRNARELFENLPLTRIH